MYSNLKDLLYCLTKGTGLHIGVLFFGHRGNVKTSLPQAYKIHAAPLCDKVKGAPEAFHACYRHRNEKVRRALEQGEPFFSVCAAGLLEYTRPIWVENEVAALVFVGNACPKGGAPLLEQKLASYGLDKEAAAFEITADEMVRYAEVVESYVCVLLADRSAALPQGTVPLIENLKNYIAENTAGEVGLAALARLFHYNEKYLGRLFKKHTGESFATYTNRCRMQKAAALLEQGEKSVTEVAAATGFSSVCYFNRVFKGFWGVTPTAYRLRK